MTVSSGLLVYRAAAAREGRGRAVWRLLFSVVSPRARPAAVAVIVYIYNPLPHVRLPDTHTRHASSTGESIGFFVEQIVRKSQNILRPFFAKSKTNNVFYFISHTLVCVHIRACVRERFVLFCTREMDLIFLFCFIVFFFFIIISLPNKSVRRSVSRRPHRRAVPIITESLSTTVATTYAAAPCELPPLQTSVKTINARAGRCRTNSTAFGSPCGQTVPFLSHTRVLNLIHNVCRRLKRPLDGSFKMTNHRLPGKRPKTNERVDDPARSYILFRDDDIINIHMRA